MTWPQQERPRRVYSRVLHPGRHRRRETATFLGERHRRLSRRIGGNRASCAVARSILTIVRHLLSDPAARFADLGPGWHDRKTDRDRKIRAHVRQLQALGLNVELTPATA